MPLITRRSYYPGERKIMFKIIYLEEEIANHPRVHNIISQFPDASIVNCKRYTGIFNRKSQNFRLQKKQPALILASKFKNFVLSAPENYGIGSNNNYYFSHMLNCIYDCRYCFLQGMYRSAHYVVFINFEDFLSEIDNRIHYHEQDTVHFFSGYDCDSLALEPVTGFTEFLLPQFRKYKNALLELRTKSTQIRSLLDQEPMNNVVVAYSFTPAEIAESLEYKTPTVQKRIDAMIKLQNAGWKLGLRFDPLIFEENYQVKYKRLFDHVFKHIKLENLHSVSLGSFRLPKSFFHTVKKLYPDEILFASPLEEKNGMVSYQEVFRDEMLSFCHDILLGFVPEEKFFPCHDTNVQ